MKRKIIIALAAATTMFNGRIGAQTNDVQSQTNTTSEAHEFRIVNRKVYDVTTSTKWVSIIIPAGTCLWNANQIRLTKPMQPTDVMFQIPAIYNNSRPVRAHIRNFPYDPADFTIGQIQDGVRAEDPRKIALEHLSPNATVPHIITGVVTRSLLNLRVFPLDVAKTNWNALGVMTIIPARPEFDYGLPYTNKVSEVQKTEAQP
jgi:hypothetical protein